MPWQGALQCPVVSFQALVHGTCSVPHKGQTRNACAPLCCQPTILAHEQQVVFDIVLQAGLFQDCKDAQNSVPDEMEQQIRWQRSTEPNIKTQARTW